MVNPLYTLSGLFVGFLVGVTGVGGGSLMTPMLILLFGFHPSTAVGTDLLQASVTKSVGTAIHNLLGAVDCKIVGQLALGSVPATAVGTLLLSALGAESQEVTSIISGVLTCALILTAVVLIFRERVLAGLRGFSTTFGERRIASLTTATGFVLGLMVTLSSVGAGALGVTALAVLYPRLPTLRIVGSDIAHAVPLTLLAGLGHWLFGAVSWPLFLSLALGSIPGIAIGSVVASRIPERLLRYSLAGLLVIAAARFVFA